MIRAVRMSNKWYCKEISEIDDEEIENIKEFISQGELVLFASGIDDIEVDIEDEIVMVD